MQGAVRPTTANPSTSSWILVLGSMTAWTIFRGPNLGGMHSAGPNCRIYAVQNRPRISD